MSDGTEIEWCDATWNFVRGCSRVSPGCENCYAEEMAHRFDRPGYWGHGLTVIRQGRPGWSHEVKLVPEKLGEPLRWRKSRKVFPCSGSDIFHEKIPFEYTAAAYGVMLHTPHHLYQVLTKRPERMAWFYEWLVQTAKARYRDPFPRCVFRLLRACMEKHLPAGTPIPDLPEGAKWPARNIWAGFTAEDQAHLDERMVHMRQVDAAVVWASLEPLLGPIDLTEYVHPVAIARALVHHNRTEHPCGGSGRTSDCDTCEVEWRDGERALDWVVVGGESGRRARPCATEWIEDLVEQCCKMGVPIFVKQLGGFVVSEARSAPSVDEANALRRELGNSEEPHRFLWRAGLKSKKGKKPEEWASHLRVRLFPGDAIPDWHLLAPKAS